MTERRLETDWFLISQSGAQLQGESVASVLDRLCARLRQQGFVSAHLHAHLFRHDHITRKAPYGSVWAVDNGAVMRFDPVAGTWTTLAGGATRLAADAHGVWSVNNQGQVHRYTNSSGGEYCFLPSLSPLRWLATLHAELTTSRGVQLRASPAASRIVSIAGRRQGSDRRYVA
ncbi:MAG: hypothetical protein JOZ65_21345 [Chloroflexi bacterium]|nr:hypothetical protein [Chloroflexota bacterium]